MGTPAVFTFRGSDAYGSYEEFNLYRHMDGDPITALTDLTEVFRKASEMTEEYREECPHIADRIILTPSLLAGLYVGETTGPMGMKARFIKDEADGYGAYRYLVDLDRDGLIAITDNDGNPSPPTDYLDRLHSDYRERFAKVLENSITALANLDFTVI